MSVNISFIVNARLPTEKAHGLAIIKTAETLVREGARLKLVVPRRSNSLSPGAIFSHYGIMPVFEIVQLPTIDFMQTGWVPTRIAFFLQSFSFYVFALLWYLARARDTIIYTRDYSLIHFAWFSKSLFYECHHLPKHKELFMRLHVKNVSVVTISQGLYDEYVSQGFTPDRLLVAPSGATRATFDISLPKAEACQLLSLPKDKYLIVYTGKFTTFSQDKGLECMIAAMSLLPKNFVFVAVGGEVWEQKRLEKIINEAGVGDQVLLRGSTDQSTLAKYQKAADVLVLPFPATGHFLSYMSPIKLFEYLFAERPILASNIPSLTSVLSESEALFIEAGNAKAWAETIEKIAYDESLSDRLSQAAYKKAPEFTWDKRGERLFSFVKKTVSKA